MSSMSSEQLQSNVSAYQNQQTAQKKYAYSASETLKKDGNKLVGEQKFNDVRLSLYFFTFYRPTLVTPYAQRR